MGKRRIDPRGVKEVNERLSRDPRERGRDAERARRDFFGFVEDNFELAPDQTEEL